MNDDEKMVKYKLAINLLHIIICLFLTPAIFTFAKTKKRTQFDKSQNNRSQIIFLICR